MVEGWGEANCEQYPHGTYEKKYLKELFPHTRSDNKKAHRKKFRSGKQGTENLFNLIKKKNGGQ
jgi:hypothetical protein